MTVVVKIAHFVLFELTAVDDPRSLGLGLLLFRALILIAIFVFLVLERLQFFAEASRSSSASRRLSGDHANSSTS